LSHSNRNKHFVILQLSNQFAHTFSSTNFFLYIQRIVTSKQIRFIRIAFVSYTNLHFIIVKGHLRNSRRFNSKNSRNRHVFLIDYLVIIAGTRAKVKGFVPLTGLSHHSSHFYTLKEQHCYLLD